MLPNDKHAYKKFGFRNYLVAAPVRCCLLNPFTNACCAMKDYRFLNMLKLPFFIFHLNSNRVVFP